MGGARWGRAAVAVVLLALVSASSVACSTQLGDEGEALLDARDRSDRLTALLDGCRALPAGDAWVDCYVDDELGGPGRGSGEAQQRTADEAGLVDEGRALCEELAALVPSAADDLELVAISNDRRPSLSCGSTGVLVTIFRGGEEPTATDCDDVDDEQGSCDDEDDGSVRIDIGQLGQAGVARTWADGDGLTVLVASQQPGADLDAFEPPDDQDEIEDRTEELEAAAIAAFLLGR